MSEPVGECGSIKVRSTQGMIVLVAVIAFACAGIANYGRGMRRTREAARRAQCLNNLKQVGMSIDQYTRRSGVGLPWGEGAYPSGTIPDPKIAPDKRCGWASLVYLLDDEGCSGCPAIFPEMAWDDPRQQVSTGRDGEMHCPSCPPPKAPNSVVPAAYVGIAGLGVDAPALQTSDKRAGIFGDGRLVRPADVSDGLARTLMVVDSSAPTGPWFAGGRDTVRGLDPSRQPYLGKGHQFGGIHGEGANVLMADGSVRHVKDSVAPKVFEAMSTIAGGENVSVPWQD